MEPNQRVIQKSIELFTQYGIRQVTMDQIAEEAGMSKRTIYELFRDKDTLVWECLETMNRNHMQEVKNILASASNVIEALYRAGLHGEKKKSVINHLFFEDLRKVYPQFWTALKQRTQPGTGSFSCKILEQGVREGIFVKDMNVEIVDAFFYVIMETFNKKELFPENISHKDLFRNIILPYFRGISTDKGKELIEKYDGLL
ncbi:MAG: TetR/AcrR family transcriptional regulator [Bacteroidales bacterium]|nr:TetR/AcrR family transcriptional regulator [Lentimicrobiaceae bacterium]MDD5694388.1 TetR/AcrR family transcriptional regulator [Bacteroidales bacterium]